MAAEREAAEVAASLAQSQSSDDMAASVAAASEAKLELELSRAMLCECLNVCAPSNLGSLPIKFPLGKCLGAR